MASRNYAIVTLTPINHPDTVSHRILKFNSVYDTVDVGRSSKSEGKSLDPDTDNAWFSSRVISRTHAKIWTNPDSKQVYVKDVGSMHGTYLGEVRLPPNLTHNLENGDIVRFGSEVIRGSGTLPDGQDVTPKILGNAVAWLPIWSSEDISSCLSNRELPESFPPLDMRVTYEWKEGQDTGEQVTDHHAKFPAPFSRARVYSVPEDCESEDDRAVNVSSVRDTPRRGYSVPDSDVSEAGSFEDEEPSGDTPSSSPRKLMQTTIDLIKKPLSPKQPENNMDVYSPAKSNELPQGPSGLTEQEKHDDECTFRAMGLRGKDKVVIVLDGDEDGSQKNPIPVDYDTIQFQNSRQDKLSIANSEESDQENLDYRSNRSSLFGSENDEDHLDKEIETFSAHDDDGAMEKDYPGLDVADQADGLSEIEVESTEEDVAFWTQSKATDYNSTSDEDELSENESWDEREQSVSEPPQPRIAYESSSEPPQIRLTYPGPMYEPVMQPPPTPQATTSSQPAPQFMGPACIQPLPIPVYTSTGSVSHGHPSDLTGRAPSPSDAAMAKSTSSTQSAPHASNNRWSAWVPSNYSTTPDSFTPYHPFVPPPPPRQYVQQPSNAYYNLPVYRDGPFALASSPFREANRESPRMRSSPSPELGSSRPALDQFEPVFNLNGASGAHPASSSTLQDNNGNLREARNQSPTRLEMLQVLREKAQLLREKAKNKLVEDSPSMNTPLPKVNFPSPLRDCAYPLNETPKAVPTAAKVSIDDIVDKEQIAPEPSIIANKLKRKIESIQGSLTAELAEKEAAHQLAVLTDAGLSMPAEITGAPTAQQAYSARTNRGDESEPAAKRIKTSGKSSTSTFAKYAATAFGGVVLGGIGAYAALLTLPLDSFV